MKRTCWHGQKFPDHPTDICSSKILVTLINRHKFHAYYGRVHTTALGPERFRNATGRPCSHLFHCVRSFRNDVMSSQWNGSGTGPVGSVVWTCDWTRFGTVPVARDIRRFPAHSSYLQTFITSWHLATDHLTSPYTPIDRGTSHDQICEKCPTALTSDDLDTPRAPVQIMLFVAVLFIQRYPGAPQTLFRHHNFWRANHPMIIISYMMSMCIKLK